MYYYDFQFVPINRHYLLEEMNLFILVPHFPHIPRITERPFAIVPSLHSFIICFFLHFTQYPSHPELDFFAGILFYILYNRIILYNKI